MRFSSTSSFFTSGSFPSVFNTNSTNRSNVSTIATVNRTRWSLSARSALLVARRRRLGSSRPICLMSMIRFGSRECWFSRRVSCRTSPFDFEQQRKTFKWTVRCSRRGKASRTWSTRCARSVSVMSSGADQTSTERRKRNDCSISTECVMTGV